MKPATCHKLRATRSTSSAENACRTRVLPRVAQRNGGGGTNVVRLENVPHSRTSSDEGADGPEGVGEATRFSQVLQERCVDQSSGFENPPPLRFAKVLPPFPTGGDPRLTSTDELRPLEIAR